MIGGISNNLDQAQTSLMTSMARLASAQRINSAKDDAAGLAIASVMTAQLGSSNQAIRNVYDGLSLVDTAGGALGQVSESLQRMRELAVQSANGVYTASDRQALQQEFSQLAQGVDQIAGNTQFNGRNLLDGGYSGAIQTGPDAGNATELSLGDVSTAGLGVRAAEITSASGAASALDAIDAAMTRVNDMQANIGAVSAGLNSTIANLSNSYESLAASRSRIQDADYAQETAARSRNGVQQQAALQALQAYNANQNTVLSLLNTSREG
jgi:flagellin